MEALGWIVAVVVLALAALVVWRINTRSREREAQRDAAIEAERARADRAQVDAARLPDALERAGRAEEQAKVLTGQLQEAAAKLSGMDAKLQEMDRTRNDAVERANRLEQERDEAARAATQARLEAGQKSAELDTVRETLQSALERAARLEEANGQLTEKIRVQDVEVANVAAARDAAQALYEQTKVFIDQARETLPASFRDAASKVFDEKSEALDRRIRESGNLAKESLATTLEPFAKNVENFRQRLELINQTNTDQTSNLTGAVKQLHDVHQQMVGATDSLTTALKGNAQVRGAWGEMILETVLKSSGLEEGVNFRRQFSTTDDETGGRRAPDVIFDLPDGRSVVIDAKVNLSAWADYHSATTHEERQDALLRHAAALRGSMRDLAGKNYPKLLGDNTLEMTILFVPIEGALAAAFEFDRSLMHEAFSKKVAITSPNTLMAMLKVVERLWMRDKLSKQVSIIGDEAGKLMDSLVGYLDHFQTVGDRIRQLDEAYTKAKNTLSESNQSVLARAKRLVAAGAKGKKALPEQLALEPGTEALQLSLDS